jgi:hypothetical protein
MNGREQSVGRDKLCGGPAYLPSATMMDRCRAANMEDAEGVISKWNRRLSFSLFSAPLDFLMFISLLPFLRLAFKE